MNFLQASEFARAVEQARPKYQPWCPLCGCVSIRWAGCDHSWHNRVGYLIEHPYGDSLENESSPRVATWSVANPEALTKPDKEAPL